MADIAMKTYKILLSAPSDIFKYTQNVKKAVDKLNKECPISKVFFETVDWKDSCHPQYGKKAQSVINEQIVIDSDIVIALFGARLGTPTDNHESGTIEEIELIHENGGEVLTYFGTGKLVDIKDIDTKQYDKINEYKSKYYGLYWEFKTAKELENYVYEHLKMLIPKLKKKTKGTLELLSEDEKGLKNSLVIRRFDLIKILNDNLVKDIINKIKFIENSSVKSEPTFENNAEYTYGSTIEEKIFRKHKKHFITFSKQFKSVVEVFCVEHQVKYTEKYFYSVGNAHNFTSSFMGNDLNGTQDEVAKVNALNDLKSLMEKYYGIKKVFEIIDNGYYINLVLHNNSNIYTENITIYLEMPFENNKLLKEFQFDNINAASYSWEIIGYMMKNEEKIEIEGAKQLNIPYPIVVPKYDFSNGHTYSPDLEHYNECIKCDMENIYPITLEEKDNVLRVKIEIGDLKQFTKTYVCGKLLFKNPINEIKYKITSKTLDRQIIGILDDN